MSEESRFENSLEPTIYFFVDKGTHEVAGIHMYSIFGITSMDREIKDFRPASREEDGFAEMISGKYDTYKYVWGSEPYDMSDENWDPADTTDWYPSPAKAWAKGEKVTADDLGFCTTKLEQNFVDSIDPNDLEEYS